MVLLACAAVPGMLEAQLSIDPIKAGAKTVTGKATEKSGTITSVKVNGTEEKQGNSAVSTTDGTFSVALSDPVLAGNYVVVTQTPKMGSPITKGATVTAADMGSDATITVNDVIGGDLRVTGRTSLKSGSVTVIVNGVDQTKSAQTIGGDGTFAVELKAAVITNNEVEVIITDGSDAKKELAKVTQTVLESAKKPVVVALNEPREGDKSVNGSISTEDASQVAGVKIEVLEGGRRTEQVDAAYDDKKATFVATLANPLTEGFSVHAHAVDAKGKTIGHHAETVLTSGYDWGRVRAYFSLGAQVVRTQPTYVPGSPTAGANFGSPDAYVGLNVDTNFWNSLAHYPRCPRPTADEAKTRNTPPVTDEESGCRHEDRPKKAILLNSYTEVRLTQVATSGDNSTQTIQSVGNFQGFSVEGGIYLPIIPPWMQWTFRGQDNGLFFGPIAKLGFQAAKVAAPQTANGVPADLGSTDVFKYYAFGVRTGHFKMPVTPGKEAPELLNYVDMTAGRWDNFRIFTPNGSKRYQRPWRLDVTARLKIPSTPLFVGLDVNVGSGIDDARFLFGARVDLTKALGALIPAMK